MHRGRNWFVLAFAVAAATCSDATGPIDSDADGIFDENDVCPSQPEIVNRVFDGDGCPDVVQDLYSAVRNDAESYWASVLSGTPRPYVAIGVFAPYNAPISTPCGTVPPRNAIYCPANAGVYYDEGFLAEYLALVGDMAPAYIVSHEIGHHVAWILGWPPNISPKEGELQADCFAGSWAGSAEDRGLLEEGDLDEAAAAVISVGDPDDTWFDPTLHGTAGQRLTAFEIGYEQGPVGCTSDQFFAMFPVSPR